MAQQESTKSSACARLAYWAPSCSPTTASAGSACCPDANASRRRLTRASCCGASPPTSTSCAPSRHTAWLLTAASAAVGLEGVPVASVLLPQRRCGAAGELWMEPSRLPPGAPSAPLLLRRRGGVPAGEGGPASAGAGATLRGPRGRSSWLRTLKVAVNGTPTTTRAGTCATLKLASPGPCRVSGRLLSCRCRRPGSRPRRPPAPSPTPRCPLCTPKE